MAVAVAVALASVGAYVAVRAKLRGEVDSSLRDRAGTVQQMAERAQSLGIRIPGPPPDGDEARMADRHILPERSGYYAGARLVEPALAARGAAWAVRASAEELCAASQPATVATA